MFELVPPEWPCLRSLVVGQRRGGKHISSQWRSPQVSCRGLVRKMGREWMLSEEAALKCLTQWRCDHQLTWWAIRLVPLPGCSSHPLYSWKHPALPVKTFVIHLGFPSRSSLKSQCAAQLQGAHHSLLLRNCTHTLPSQNAEHQDYSWFKVLHMAAERFTFPLQDFISCATPLTDATSNI